MTNLTKKEFLDLVEAEAKVLRTEAEKSERDNLNHRHFNHHSARNCIYGMMFGSATNDRAIKFKPERYRFKAGCGFKKSTFSAWKKSSDSEFFVGFIAYSPIEVYVTFIDAEVESLIEYIKGERETFKA